MNEIGPFSLDKSVKGKMFTELMMDLTHFHYENCPPYHNILTALKVKPGELVNRNEVVFLPVSLFKELELRSIPSEEVFKVMTSSGTTGQAVSRIYLDRVTASEQQKALVRIVSDLIGATRLPMLILDCPSVVKDRAMFSARGAGILGFSIFGTDRTFALNDDMSLNSNAVEAFLDRHVRQRIILFGFTFMIWQHFYLEILNQKCRPDLSNGVLIHGGGWKKLVANAVSPKEFHFRLRDACNLEKIHNYYGMVEQAGSIFMECPQGHLHASIFSDVIMRRHWDFSPCAIGETGIIQVLSSLPHSYPGHSLLTEDEGMLLGEDDCPCGRMGKYFKVLGRIQNAEIRGCSDTYETVRR